MAAQHFIPVELISLVGLLDALLLCALVWDFGSNSNIGSMDSLFQTHDQSMLRILVISAGLKVMAGYMYQRALQVSPISMTEEVPRRQVKLTIMNTSLVKREC
jgi:hypothetical protein